MAYFTQEQKKAIAPLVKQVCEKHGVKGSLSVRHHSGVVLTLKGGKIDFGQNNEYRQINVYHVDRTYKDYSPALAFLNEVLAVLNTGNYDNSDWQTDYAEIGHYVYINIGDWDKPYVFSA
jgi:ABC-type phosphate/phosphonate transport system substrate-binding protein